MTSKNLFFKVMREDVRHKIWMIALSFLGNFLVLPIEWLLFKHNVTSSGIYGMGDNPLNHLSSALSYFRGTVTVLGGGVAIIGALMIGLFSFRYLFYKNMVDTWHSMPVKRNVLYAAGYVNGIFIWLVPFLVNLLPATVMAGSFVYKIGGGEALTALLEEVFMTSVTLVTVYLLVYHLTLTAVMLCGNILNTLVCIVVLGFGVIGIFVIGVGICSYYLDTFTDWSYSLESLGYASPFFSALYLLYSRVRPAGISALVAVNVMQRNAMGAENDFIWSLVINLAVAAVMGFCAYFLYQERESELAEQGIRHQGMATLLRVFSGVLSGMGGWLMFMMLTENKMSIGWAIFGMVLGAVLAFGVLDAIFQMDFKGFFAHKIQMGIAVCLALLAGLSIHGDWFGYDAYLPQKDEIAGIAVYSPYFENRTFYGGVPDSFLDSMEFQDTDAVYAYLERMAKNQELESDADYDSVIVKVMLNDSRCYYRAYKVYEQDRELIWPILTSEAYLQTAYGISEEEPENIIPRIVGRAGAGMRMERCGQEEIAAIIGAYNQDILKDPERTLLGRGKLLSAIYLDIADNTMIPGYISVRLDVYDTMDNTLAALEQAGYGDAITAPDVSDISSVQLLLWLGSGESATSEELIGRARQYYGVFGKNGEGMPETAEAQGGKQAVAGTSGVRERKEVSVTDREEIEELFSYISFSNPYPFGSIFQQEWIEIAIVEGDKEHYCYIPRGVLPEKYILRFGEL